jgi:hypothetical protein
MVWSVVNDKNALGAMLTALGEHAGACPNNEAMLAQSCKHGTRRDVLVFNHGPRTTPPVADAPGSP